MAVMDVFEVTHQNSTRSGLIGSLRAAWQAALHRRQERLAMAALARRSPHVIRDMGFDPDEVYEALDGSWDEVAPGRFGVAGQGRS